MTYSTISIKGVIEGWRDWHYKRTVSKLDGFQSVEAIFLPFWQSISSLSLLCFLSLFPIYLYPPTIIACKLQKKLDCCSMKLRSAHFYWMMLGDFEGILNKCYIIFGLSQFGQREWGRIWEGWLLSPLFYFVFTCFMQAWRYLTYVIVLNFTITRQ